MPTFAPSTPTPVANLMQQDLATATYALQERCKNNPAVASVTQGNDHIIVALIDNGSAVAIPGQFLGWPVRFVDT